MKPKELTADAVWREYEKMLAYNDSIQLDDTVRVNENFFVGKQWEGVESNGLPTPVFNFLKRVTLFTVASITSDKLQLKCSPLPSGADCVLMQELTNGGEEQVRIYARLQPNANVVFRGEDIAAGAPIAAAGTVLTPAHIGVLAGQGIPDAEVFRPLTVGVLATGSELLEAGEAWAPGKIYDANGIQNAARLRQLGFAVERTHCSDDPEEIAARMQDLLTRCDAVITSGGVSVGQKDYLPTVLEMLHAEPVFAGVAQKPGSPMITAQVGEKLVFCLSGNPFAAAATLEQYAVPALLRAAGRREEDCIPVHTRGRLTTGFSKPSKGTRFLRARALGGLVEIPGEGNAEAHSSGSLSAMMGCNCLVELPAGSGPVAPGEEVEVLNFVQ